LEDMAKLEKAGVKAHAILFDPFSPKANPEAWTSEVFRLAAALLAPGGRLVTYSVSRTAKDAAASAGLIVEKHPLPAELNKRSALLATKKNL
jgi:tRNA U34 5-methylaminomethyl-2-thiouridine-forming methyltransferase MnmC